MKWFRDNFIDHTKELEILDIGSLNSTNDNFNYKSLFSNPKWNYNGLDYEDGNNVDILVDDIYNWEKIKDQSYDVIISGQLFEHLKFFWITMEEIERVLKYGGYCCIIAPSSGPSHGSGNNDCYRFYEDGMKSLAKHVNFEILHVSTNNNEESKPWYDSCLVAQKNLMFEKNNEIKQINDKIDYYKENYNKTKKLNKDLNKKFLDISNKYDKLLNERTNEKTAASFCDLTYIDYYLKDDFDEKFGRMIKNLPNESRKLFKLLFLRALSFNLLKQDTLFFEDELNQQKYFKEFKLENTSEKKINEFVFEGDYNLHGFYDLNLTEDDKKFIKNKDIIDAGAFTGDTALPLSKFTNKKIYAFEPFENSYKHMVNNVKNNNIKNILPINKSLGDKNGERTLFLSSNNFQGITCDENIRKYNEKIIVPEVTIDSFVKEYNLDVGLITIDVEGAEQNLLNGAINTIKKQKPILFISIYHKIDDLFEIKPWVENLDLNYEFDIIKEQPWTFIADTVLQCRVR
jgi:FkbM family methyltransferase